MPAPLLFAVFIALRLVPSLQAQEDVHVEAEGRVIRIDPDAGRLGLDHGPIPNVMPPMRMLFRVERKEVLRDLHVDDHVRFTLTLRGVEWVITEVEKTEQ